MGFNILLADDSGTMRSMVAKTLEMSGVPIGRLHEASNGQEALAIMEREWIDMLFVDINMPVMSGIELIDTLRGKPEFAHFPIVVISTESSETRIEEVRKKGVQFIHKPFTPERVREVVQSLVGDPQDAGTSF